ncbi:ATP-binding protein [Streptomyces sp. V4I2]|uniref:ATP-binding protein n=1 Tax=Streptomyces sp. V4I2 TaxID=3042280 RepID=UPI0027887DF6|nr:ATP-binding protein [Streptomyces sp. V4I2]MDQ1047927.1 anti-sigma regulatory factor (Ser/Thr protein kinase) [Streptomyces sp. V4I2]
MPENEAEPWEYCLYIPNDLRAVTVSRRTLRLILTMHGLIGLVDVAELLAAELVSNAVRHTKGPAALRVCWSAGVLRIGAWDADLWGWHPLARQGNRGKFVWCELAAATAYVGNSPHQLRPRSVAGR